MFSLVDIKFKFDQNLVKTFVHFFLSQVESGERI